jgi:hypothetical protein
MSPEALAGLFKLNIPAFRAEKGPPDREETKKDEGDKMDEEPCTPKKRGQEAAASHPIVDNFNMVKTSPQSAMTGVETPASQPAPTLVTPTKPARGSAATTPATSATPCTTPESGKTESTQPSLKVEEDGGELPLGLKLFAPVKARSEDEIWSSKVRRVSRKREQLLNAGDAAGFAALQADPCYIAPDEDFDDGGVTAQLDAWEARINAKREKVRARRRFRIETSSPPCLQCAVAATLKDGERVRCSVEWAGYKTTDDRVLCMRCARRGETCCVMQSMNVTRPDKEGKPRRWMVVLGRPEYRMLSEMREVGTGPVLLWSRDPRHGLGEVHEAAERVLDGRVYGPLGTAGGWHDRRAFVLPMWHQNDQKGLGSDEWHSYLQTRAEAVAAKHERLSQSWKRRTSQAHETSG